MRILLVDNGSLEIAAYRNLCAVAEALSGRIGHAVDAAPLLHADRVDPAENNGEPIRIWMSQMESALQAGEREFLLVPFFFGPSRAITTYVPERVEELKERFGEFTFHTAPFLFAGDETIDFGLADILMDRIRETISHKDLRNPRVILVDHGSPIPSVTYVRNYLAGQLSVLLQNEAAAVAGASMERREGDKYAFNDPLLAAKLDAPGYREGDVVVAMLFLSPGRHAGPNGDVATICADAEARNEGLRTHVTGLVGTHPGIVDLLHARVEASGARIPSPR